MDEPAYLELWPRIQRLISKFSSEYNITTLAIEHQHYNTVILKNDNPMNWLTSEENLVRLKWIQILLVPSYVKDNNGRIN